MSLLANNLIEPAMASKAQPMGKKGSAFEGERCFTPSHLVYYVISPRAHGLSIGLNLNPDKNCNFDCQYCEVERSGPPSALELDVDQMASELQKALVTVFTGHLRDLPAYKNIPSGLLELRHVTLSGDGEPTLCDQFEEVVQSVVHVRATGYFPLFKIVLVTNGSGLDRDCVQNGLRYFKPMDEIWIKLDAGTQAYMDRVNRARVPLETILDNILLVAQKRPVVIQSLFASLNGSAPAWDEIESYTARLEELCAAGAKISLVQIYSATRPNHNATCGHLPLRTLSKIAQHVRLRTGLRVEVY